MALAGQVTASDLQAMLADGALAGSWTLDASRSSISLRSKSVWGLAPVKGGFREIAGTGTVSPDGQVSGTITVAAASVDTKNAKRDAHLRSAEFFDAEAHPDITVHVEGLAPASQGVTGTGTLTVRGRTRPLTFGATVSTPDNGEIWLDAEIQVNRADYGMTWSPMRMASMDNMITIHAAFTRT
jgi:polyisoprenoid-binding protein YceI